MEQTTATLTADDDMTGQLGEDDYIEEEMLVEEISIDGMCGVY